MVIMRLMKSNAVASDRCGFEKVENILNIKDLYNPQDPWAHYMTNALKAKELFT